MTKKFLKDSLGWGILLWLIGYVLGIILFAFVPADLLGWIIMPIGIVITLFVLFKIIRGASFRHSLGVAVIWTLIAVIFDYLFLVELFHPADGYYKPDIYLYYILTFILPLLVWIVIKNKKR